MRIASNSVSESIVRQIQQLSTRQSQLQNQVATGLRIAQPEDDPAAVGRVLNLESNQRQVAQFEGNSSRAHELNQASYAGLQAIKKVSDRANEIGTLGVGLSSDAAAQAYAVEIDQLIEQTLQFANTRFGNDYIYAGTAVDSPPFVADRDADGKVSAVHYVGNANQTSVALSDTASVAPGTDGATNQGLGDFLTHLISLRDALDNNNASNVTAAQTNLITSEDLLVSALAEHGGVQTRIEATQAQLSDRSQSLAKLVSGETEADLPATIVKLTQTQTAYQAALQSAANIMKISLLDYIH